MEKRCSINFLSKKIVIFVLLVIIFCFLCEQKSFADNIEGTNTYKDYLFVLIHGMNDSKDLFVGKKGYGNLKNYLETNLGLKGRVFCYSFSNNRGDNFVQAKELGDRNYQNPGQGMNNNCWLEKAKIDFKNEFPDSDVPNKFIFITHSMGNYAARMYIYSDQLFKDGFYDNDVSKIVFVAPPLLGSDMAVFAYKGYIDGATTAFQGVKTVKDTLAASKNFDFSNTLYNALTFMNNNPFYPYEAATDIAANGILLSRATRMMLEEFNKVVNEKKTFGLTSQAIFDLLPFSNATTKLKKVRPLSPELEPGYSIVYAKGMPVFDYGSTFGMGGMKWLNEDEFKKESNLDLLNQFLSLDYQELSLLHPGFWKIGNSEGKFLSLLLAKTGEGYFTHDGDGLVPEYSARGEGIKYLENAKRYSHTFQTQKFEDFLNNSLPTSIAATETAIYFTASWTGTPPNQWWFLRIPVVTYFISEVINNYDNINYDIEAHGNILKQYGLIETALLDTPAIFTVQDIQANVASTSPATSKATAMTITSPRAPPKGYESLKIKTIKENRAYKGNQNMTIPITIDGDRKYVNEMVFTKPPLRIEGKLNYLIPARMKQFQYSFNFAAWKDIKNVDSKTGEFVLDKLPFAEGQNVLAIRAINAVDVQSHQICKFIVNTIPMVISEMKPEPNSYTNDNKTIISGEFNKSVYSTNKKVGEGIPDITSAELYKDAKLYKNLLNDSNFKEQNIKVSDYKTVAKFTYSPSTPLPDGEYKIIVKSKSSVGTSQGVWSFWVDTKPPTLTIAPPEALSANKSLTIKYKVSDNLAVQLKDISCGLFDSKDNLITRIATADSVSKGEHFFTWNGKKQNGSAIPNGSYYLSIKVYDQAGNKKVANKGLIMDSTPPRVKSAEFSPKTMTSNSNSQKVTVSVSEPSTVFIKMKNKDTGKTDVFLAKSISHKSTGAQATYTWDYSSQFLSGLKDGLYEVEITAQDMAGNESKPYKIPAIRVDRTPPVIYAQAALPYVLANSGSSPYTTTLSYRISDQGTGNSGQCTVKIIEEKTGKVIKTFSSAPCSLSSVNSIKWNALTSVPWTLSTGSYQFKIIAEDKFGNLAIAYASCVKDGIAPVITFPAANSDLSGVVAIKGTAIDPDWTNDKPFERYRLYYAEGNKSPPSNLSFLDSSWKKDFIEIPKVNADGTRPLQGNSTLAYFYTTGLKNNQYTLLVVVEEKGGMKVASTRVINVYNDPQEATDTPYIKLMPVASSIDYKSDDSKKLSIGFVNSVKPANVYVEVLKSTSHKSQDQGRVIYYKKFPNVAGAPFIGKPTYDKTKDLGYFIWKDVKGTWHIEWSHDGKLHKFSGNIVAMGGKIIVPRGKGQGSKVSDNLVSWDTNSSGGFSFKTDANVQQLMITPKIDEDPKSPQIYASNVYLGVAKKTVSYLPIMIDVKNNSLADLVASSKGQGSSSGGHNPFSSGCEWDGKLDTGAYADSGNYIVRVRAEGVDGFGLSTDEAKIKIKTPFEVKNIEVSPDNHTFNTLGSPDRVSVFYNVSKDSNVSAYVYDYSKNLIATLFENKSVLGGLNPLNKHSLYWKGNYPDPKSGAIVTSGNYLIKLIIAAKDGSGNFVKEISKISVEETFKNENYAKLDQIGDVGVYQGSKARFAEGESPYYFEAKGSGYYHPPRDFNYTLNASGKQRFTMYPYVPFAGLMHRGFKQVDVKAKITYRVHYHYYIGYRFLHGEVWGDDKYDIPSEVTYSLRENKAPLHDEEICYPRGDRGSVTKVQAKVQVYAAGDKTFLLDSTDWFDVTTGTDGQPTKKGIFSADFRYDLEKTQKIGYGLGTGAVSKDLHTYRAKFDLKLEDKIAYSRLTNRFIPWFGFVNKNNPQTKDFTSYLANIETGLGFPGKIFFNDPTAKPGAPYDKTPAELAASLGGKSWKEKIAEFNKLAKQANLKGYKGSLASSVGFDSYLSDEYFEFIPITAPAGQSFEKANSTTYTAKTAVTSDTFVFDWPNPDQSIATWTAKYGKSGTNYKDLIGSGSIDNPEFAQKWDGYGREENVCFYELDMAEVNKSKNNAKASKSFSAKTLYDKKDGNSTWQSTNLLGELLPVSDKIEDIKYSVSSSGKQLKVDLLGDSRTGQVYVEDQTSPQSWSTEDDITLLAYGGKVHSKNKLFNDKDFRGRRYIDIFPEYKISEDFSSKAALKYTFLKKDIFNRNSGIDIDNPNLEIKNWKLELFDKRKEKNSDLKIEQVNLNKDDHSKDYFVLKLDTHAKEKRFVEIKGSVSTAYELLYFDGEAWRNIARASSGRSGHLAWWNVSRLNGKYTVLLRTGSYISTQDINIGTLVKNGEEKNVFSAYRRAQLSFPGGAFKSDQLVTITPVTMTEIKIQNRPIIMTHGPIVEIKPSPYKFILEKRPTLSFHYTFFDLKNLGFWSGSESSVKVGQNLGLGLNIHQITSSGDLQIVSNNKQSVVKDGNGDLLYAFEAPLDHFSTYTLVDGKFSLSAPIVYADRYITNKNTVNIWGTADAESELQVYVAKGPKTSFTSSPVSKGTADSSGKFKFNKIKLLREGKNYIYVVSNPKGDKSVSTSNYVEIEKDTVPPKASATLNLQAFSPNEDGKWDTVTYTMFSNEKGNLEFIITDPNSKPLVTESLSVEANKPLRLAWGKNGFNIYQEVNAGAWVLKKTIYAPYKFPDGYYSCTVFSIDSAGNISNNISDYVIIDTTPPKVLALLANPNPFTPNNDGIKDSTKFSFKLSEPSYATVNILRDDGVLFKKHSKTIGDFKYPSLKDLPSVVSRKSLVGSWIWDGRGARNELIGGSFSYYLKAEDAVGNTATSDAKTIKIDHAPSLLAYAYSDPDPFSPAQGNATKIKYYLARDNCIVQSYIVGADGKSIKNLVFGEIQNKGEHSALWYGDYLPGYKGTLYGKDSSKVADGMYEFKVIAQDADGGKPASVSNTVLVDNTPPTLFIYPIKVDYITGKATLKYNIPEPASMKVLVYDVDGKYLKSLYKGLKSSGTYSLEYKNDKTDYKQKYFKIVAEDKAKNSMEKTTELFALDVSDSLKIINHTANPAAFTPNADSHTDLTRISYSITGGVPGYAVTVKILDSANSTIKTIIDDETQTAGLHNYYWAGETDSKNQKITDAVYQYEIIVEDKLGDKTTAKAEILTIVSKPTVTISTDPDTFSPNGDSSSDTALLEYTVDYPAQWITDEAQVKIDIKTGTGEVVFTKSFQHSPGTYNYTWDGSLLPQGEGLGMRVPAGTYYIYINATDALGTPAQPQNTTVIVNYDVPSLSILSVDNNPFSPNVNSRKDTTSISYSLAEDAYITIDVKDSKDQLVRTLIDNKWTGSYVSAKAIPTISWDGTNTSGSIVSDGLYKILISSIDQAGNMDSISTQVEVDNAVPSIPSIVTIASFTNEATLKYEGMAEVGSKVEIYNNDSLTATCTADSKGNFTKLISLNLDLNNLKSRSIDIAGNVTSHSDIQLINYETDLPVVTNLQVSPNPCKSTQLNLEFTVSETLESDPLVTINSNRCRVTSKKVKTGEEWQYYYSYNVSGSDQQGMAEIKITFVDLAGNESEYISSNLLEIDTITPQISNFDFTPKYAKLGNEISIDFSVSEDILGIPSVKVGSDFASFSSKQNYSASRTDYSYKYTVSANDPDQTTPITIAITDEAYNYFEIKYDQLVIDKTSPEVTSYSISSDPYAASTEEVEIKFTISEILNETPDVRVSQLNAVTNIIPVTSLDDYNYSAKYQVIAGYDGEARIAIRFKDRALNDNLKLLYFNVDTIAPSFSSLSSNPIHVREGNSSAISFDTSEDLAFNPDVTVNGEAANYSTLSNKEYGYQYLVKSNDQNGLAEIEIVGEDFAGNVGSLKSSSVSESFSIDTVIPVVVSREASPGNIMIAQPSPFTPNKDGIEDTVAVYYTLSEPAYVTVKVYAVSDKWPYTSSDFINYYRVQTLITDQWQSGQQNLIWNGSISNNLFRFDKNSNKYVDSGKYAFIVEARDRAGNITERKYGGTVWVQDSILKLEGADQWSNQINPDPRIFSPGVTAANTTLYFRVNRGSYPKDFKSPEWISAMAIDDNDIDWDDITIPGNNVGTYTARVYDSNGSLVRTIVSGINIKSSVLTSVKWDGKNDSGSFVSDGRYRIVIDVEDYTGVSAHYGNLLERWLIIDRTAPTLSGPSVSNQYISPNSSQSTATKSTSINYSLSDNFSNITDEANNVRVIVEVYNTLANAIEIQDLTMEVTASLVSRSMSWNGSLVGGTTYVGNSNVGGVYPDGTYTYQITATDLAGNVVTISASNLVVDTEGPDIATGGQSDGVWYNGDNNITVSLSDKINYQGFRWNWDSAPTGGPSGSSSLTSATTKHPSQGTNVLYIVAWDRAGNETSTQMTYMRDTTDPQAVFSGQAADTWYSSNNDINIAMSDNLSYRGFRLSWDQWPDSNPSGCDTDTSATVNLTGQGARTLHLYVWDWAGNRIQEQKTYYRDYTAPTVSFGGQTSDVWYSGDSAITISLSDNLNYCGYKWSWGSWPSSDPTGCITSNSGSTKHPGQGINTLFVRAWDQAGNRVDSSKTYRRDSIDPTITPPSSATFNPYLNSLPLSFSVGDPSASSGMATVTAKIMFGSTTIKDLTLSGSYSTSWDGTNNSNDYVNEGSYTLEIYARDNAGNTTTNSTCTITLQDDQYISVGSDPHIFIDGNLYLIWINGVRDAAKTVDTYTDASGGADETNKWFYINHDGCKVSIQTSSDGCDTKDRFLSYAKYNGDKTGVKILSEWGNSTKTVTLNKGWYWIHTYVQCGWPKNCWGNAVVNYKYRWYTRYFKSCVSEYEDNIGAATTSGPVEVGAHSSEPTSVSVGGITHSVSVGKGILYQKNNSAKIKIANGGNTPVVTADSSGNAYVAWNRKVGFNNYIYFQKIPSNFAPINGSVSATKIGNQKPTTEAQATNVPELISPTDGATVTLLRPTVKWRGIRGTTDYSINFGKTTLLSTPDKTFSKSATQNEGLYFAYTIHEFDEGLARGTWQWQVVANPTQTNEAKSAIWSFDVDPPLTIAGITNYPNPFNSNIERTKIRYRLGADADEVTIRIYDITGGLVRELDGSTNAESSSIWGKYNDVEWDGRNDRGDLVLNGIYPYEILARLGSISISGRGKMAVLK